jgi:DNA-binding XRE family transcriptional regulator
MNYTQFFKKLREEKKLTHDSLAKLARCHRNTVVNLENGRPVKFRTIAELMLVMGYGSDSVELRSVALLWLESISGIQLARDDSNEDARRRISLYRASEKDAAQLLCNTVLSKQLTVDQIRTLLFAASKPEVIQLLEHVRTVMIKARAAKDDSDLTDPPVKGA